MKSNLVKFGALGVSIGIEVAQESQKEIVIERIKEVLPIDYSLLHSDVKTDHQFFIRSVKKGKFELYKENEEVVGESKENIVLDRLDSEIRITLAEFADGFVFVHSGVVSWGDKVIMIPASSFEGKTTLVSELVKLGAVYYSDEYAVLDRNGLVHPFAKSLSMREKDGGFEQTDVPVELFGGIAGESPVSVGMVLITKYKKRSRWKPEILTRGQGVLEIIQHTVPIRNNPKLSLNVLNKVVNSATVVKSNRGEAERFAKKLIDYFEKNVLNSS